MLPLDSLPDLDLSSGSDSISQQSTPTTHNDDIGGGSRSATTRGKFVISASDVGDHVVNTLGSEHESMSILASRHSYDNDRDTRNDTSPAASVNQSGTGHLWTTTMTTNSAVSFPSNGRPRRRPVAIKRRRPRRAGPGRWGDIKVGHARPGVDVYPRRSVPTPFNDGTLACAYNHILGLEWGVRKGAPPIGRFPGDGCGVSSITSTHELLTRIREGTWHARWEVDEQIISSTSRRVLAPLHHRLLDSFADGNGSPRTIGTSTRGLVSAKDTSTLIIEAFVELARGLYAPSELDVWRVGQMSPSSSDWARGSLLMPHPAVTRLAKKTTSASPRRPTVWVDSAELGSAPSIASCILNTCGFAAHSARDLAPLDQHAAIGLHLLIDPDSGSVRLHLVEMGMVDGKVVSRVHYIGISSCTNWSELAEIKWCMDQVF